MTKYLYRMTCVLLAFAIGVAVTQITIAIRHRFRNRPTIDSNKNEPERVPVALPRRVWHEPQSDPLILPTSMKSALDKRFPGWTYLPVEDEIRKFLKENVSANARPDLISGDFDGNGRTDFAALIEEDRKAWLVVFLTNSTGFRMQVLEPGGAYLVLMKRGDWDYSYETDQYFTYQNDAIFAGIFEKGGTSYVYEKGRFKSVITSD